MKKYFSLILVLVLAMAMTVSAFAADSTVVTKSDAEDSRVVTAQFEAGENKNKPEDVDVIYHVTLDWTVDSTLKYSAGTTTYTWNADDTKYEAATDGDGWTGDATVTVTITNKSNAAITATTAWKNGTGLTVDATVTDETTEIDSAAKNITVIEDDATGVPQTDTVKVEFEGADIEGTISENNAVIGTVTVTLAPKA